MFRFAWLVALFVTAVFLIQRLLGEDNITWWGTATSIVDGFGAAISNRTFWTQAIFVFFLFIANFLIFLGPMMLMGISQIRGYEPGDATWGVKLEDVRGQAEAKEEVKRIVDLWQSGELFEKAGGKRERGLLFLGAPGTGKTMLAKAIATGFNSPIVTIPGSGFAQTFIGIDALIVRWLAHKAKKLAAKWGGQCIVFIDEIDAVGMRRQALQGASMTLAGDPSFYGPWGALNSSGDLVVESAAWRDYLFARRAPESRSPYPPWMRKFGNILNQGAFPGMMGGGQGQLALNQLLVTMDGIDNPPFLRRIFTNRTNTILDAMYIIPRRIGSVSLRIPHARPTGNQIYFIGATNVPIENLDPGAHPAGAHGPPRLVPDADEGRPEGHLRPLPRPGQPRSRARPSAAPRRDRADHERLLAGDDRADLLDGADERPPREASVRSSGGTSSTAMTTIESGTAVGVRYVDSRDACDRDPRGRPRRDCARLQARTSSRAGSRSGCAATHSDITRRSRRRSASTKMAVGGSWATSSTRSAPWPPSTRSTARRRTASAAISSTRQRARRSWSAPPAWGRHGSTSLPRNMDDESEAEARERIMQALREDRTDADEPNARLGRLPRRPGGVRPP